MNSLSWLQPRQQHHTVAQAKRPKLLLLRDKHRDTLDMYMVDMDMVDIVDMVGKDMLDMDMVDIAS